MDLRFTVGIGWGREGGPAGMGRECCIAGSGSVYPGLGRQGGELAGLGILA